jgi:hypothetical protein
VSSQWRIKNPNFWNSGGVLGSYLTIYLGAVESLVSVKIIASFGKISYIIK